MLSLAQLISSRLLELSNLLHAHRVDCYMSLASTSVYSGMSMRMLHRHIHSSIKPLPAFKIGGKWLIKRSEFDRWAEQYRHEQPQVDLDGIIRTVLGKGSNKSRGRGRGKITTKDGHHSREAK